MNPSAHHSEGRARTIEVLALLLFVSPFSGDDESSRPHRTPVMGGLVHRTSGEGIEVALVFFHERSHVILLESLGHTGQLVLI